MVSQILSGLQHIHSRRVVHLDLKPENLLFENKERSAKLNIVDFGIAWLLPESGWSAGGGWSRTGGGSRTGTAAAAAEAS